MFYYFTCVRPTLCKKLEEKEYEEHRNKLQAEGERKAQSKDDVELNKLYNKQQTTEGTYVTYKSS